MLGGDLDIERAAPSLSGSPAAEFFYLLAMSDAARR